MDKILARAQIIFPDFLGILNFPDQIAKFPDFSLTFRKTNFPDFSLTSGQPDEQRTTCKFWYFWERSLSLYIYITTDFKSAKECVETVRKANQVLGMIRRHFVLKDIMQLYKGLVYPHLEYCVQVWNPHYKKDINLVENEKVQRCATHMSDGLEHVSYQYWKIKRVILLL